MYLSTDNTNTLTTKKLYLQHNFLLSISRKLFYMHDVLLQRNVEKLPVPTRGTILADKIEQCLVIRTGNFRN
jgi:hypothetical protein